MKSSSWIPSLNHCFCHRFWLRSLFICTQSQLRRELHWFQNSCYLKLRQNHALLMRTVSLIYQFIGIFFFTSTVESELRNGIGWVGGGVQGDIPPINRTSMVKGIKMIDICSTQHTFSVLNKIYNTTISFNRLNRFIK